MTEKEWCPNCQAFVDPEGELHADGLVNTCPRCGAETEPLQYMVERGSDGKWLAIAEPRNAWHSLETAMDVARKAAMKGVLPNVRVVAGHPNAGGTEFMALEAYELFR